MRIIRDLLADTPRRSGTDLAGALEAASRVMKHSGVVFIISDFLTQGYEVALKRLACKHDVVAICIGDLKEGNIPDLGQILFFDPETGQEQLVDTSSYAFKKWLKDFQGSIQVQVGSALKGSKIDLLKIQTQDDYGEAVVGFFRARSRRKR